MRDVVILGSTGSVGTQALEVIADQPEQFRVVGLAAGGSQIGLLARQIFDSGALVVALSQATAVQDLQLALYAEASRRGWATGEVRLPKILAGPDAADKVAAMPCDVVLNAITGSAGLTATLAALRAGRVLALANKESLVVGGPLVTRLAAPGPAGGGRLRALGPGPVPAGRLGRRGRSADPDGQRRTVPGAYPGADGRRDAGAGAGPPHLVDGPGDHHQLGHAGQQGSGAAGGPPAVRRRAGPDRRRGAPAVDRALHGAVRGRVDHRPVLAADHEAADRARPQLAGPADQGRPGLDWSTASSWTFEPLDHQAFPAVELARRAGALGGTAPAVYNAANEECVDAFHDGRIGFLAILDIVAAVLDEHTRLHEDRRPRPNPDVGSTLVTSADLTLEIVLGRRRMGSCPSP